VSLKDGSTVSKAGGTELAVLASELESARQERDVLREQLQNTQLMLESIRVEMTVCLNTSALSFISNQIHKALSIINVKKLQFIHTVNGDRSKMAKNRKKAILTTITSPECQCYCG